MGTESAVRGGSPGAGRSGRPARVAALAFAAALVAASAWLPQLRAESIDDIPNPRTRDGTWVTDTAGILKPETVQQLNELASQLERDTSAELAVVVIRSLDGSSVEDLATRLFERWGIGKKDKDNGILFLWATGERRVRIEVGYGLEGMLPDGKVGAILDQYVIPSFKTEAWDAGVLEGVKAVAGIVRQQPVSLLSPGSESYDTGSSGSLGRFLLGLFGLVPVGAGSFWGYRRWRRHHRRICPQCQTSMTRLSEISDDEFLEPAQQLEERLRSIDYDVWKCPECDHRFVLRYPRWFSRFSKCPQCANRTRSSTQETLRAATTSSSGLARVTEICQFCTFRRTYNKTLPQLSSSSSSGSGGSSSSFGGGSSGGGGASRSY